MGSRGRRQLIWTGAALVVVAFGGFWAWTLTLPPGAAATGAPPVDEREMQAILDAPKLPKRERPVIAVIGLNDATERYGAPTARVVAMQLEYAVDSF